MVSNILARGAACQRAGGAGLALETHMPDPNGASLGPSLVVSW